MNQKKVKVRIAVAVDKKGRWRARGWDSTMPERDVVQMESALGGLSLNSAQYFIEAELSIPEAKTVKGEVKP